MLKSLRLKNFKAFGEEANIPLAPITLLFGKNSSGKSSVLEALHLLKQTRDSGTGRSVLLPRAEEGIVDLGSFQELLFDHELKRNLIVQLDVEIEDDRRAWGVPGKSLGMRLEFSRPSLEEEIRLKNTTFRLNGEDISSFKRSEKVPDLLRRRLHPRHRQRYQKGELDITSAKCKWITNDEEYWSDTYEYINDNKEDILKRINDDIKEVKEKKDEKDKEEILGILRDAKNLLKGDINLRELIEFIDEKKEYEYIGVDSFIPASQASKKLGLSSIMPKRPIRVEPEIAKANIGKLAVSIGRFVDEKINKIFPLGPFREPPSRWYIFTGTIPQNVGYEGGSLPDMLYRKPDLKERTNEWLEKLDIDYEIDTPDAGSELQDLFEVRMIDKRRGGDVDVSLQDVGFGISQILPLIVQSLTSEGRIISIEQPEVHIHPKLQADLGNLLADSIGSPRHNQFIIETHSEHLILRIQRLIREGKLAPEDVSVIHVQRNPDGASPQRLRLDGDGQFIDEWPGGFFPERIRELI